MAEKVNLRQSEYETIGTELSNMHTTQLENINGIIDEIRTMVTDEQVFAVNDISSKITDMLDVLSTDVVALLEQIFEGSENGVANMITSMSLTDSVSA